MDGKNLARKTGGRKKKEIYKKAEVFEKGTILTDVLNNKYELTETLGQGAFGTLYRAKKIEVDKKESGTYAIKIEPHENGPLFTEKNFFIRYLKTDIINEWKNKHGKKFLGVPEYHGFGSVSHNGVEYRFIIMNVLGDSINKKLFQGDALNMELLQVFTQQIIDVLQFIHENGYMYGDIKPENLLLNSNPDLNEVYLVDYGIVRKFSNDSDFKQKQKKNQKHCGTMLYSSRDSHCGFATRRGDFESLGYNLLQWSGVKLPWEKDIASPEVVYNKKVSFMENIKELKVSKLIMEFMKYVENMKENSMPDYKHVRDMFNVTGVKRKGTTKKSDEKKFKKNEPLDEKEIEPKRNLRSASSKSTVSASSSKKI